MGDQSQDISCQQKMTQSTRNFENHTMILVCWICTLLVLMASRAQAKNIPINVPKCNPNLVDRLPPKIQKICDALDSIWDLSGGMENYNDDLETLRVLVCLFKKIQ